MGIQATGSRPVVNPDVGLILRIEETLYNMVQQGGVNTPPRQLAHQFPLSAVNVGAPSMLGNQTVPGGTTTPLAGGRLVIQIPSGAAALVRQDNTLNGISVPLTQQFQDVNAPPLNRAPRSYTFLVPVRITVAGTARVQIGLSNGPGMLDFVGTPPAAVWSSDPAVNAGRWLPRFRRLNAGAIVNGPDSGITATAWHLLGLRYSERTTPSIEWLLDSVPRHLVAGDADMPPLQGPGIFYPGFVPSYGVFTPAGTTVQFGAALFELRNL